MLWGFQIGKTSLYSPINTPSGGMIYHKYEFMKSDSNNLNLGWTLDFRNLITNDKQTYSINGTTAVYEQDSDLTREISLLASLNYEKKIFNNGDITLGIDAKKTNQDVDIISGSLGFKINF